MLFATMCQMMKSHICMYQFHLWFNDYYWKDPQFYLLVQEILDFVEKLQGLTIHAFQHVIG